MTNIAKENRIVKAFEKEVNLTEEGLAVLVKDKASLVILFDTPAGMTIARKERTERNKLIESVKRVSIDTESAIKAKRESIIVEITEAYSCIVDPFEKEALRLKQEKERLAVIEEKRVEGIKKEITGLRSFANNLYGLSSQELSDIIESVDMIDVEDNFAEFTQEAMQVKKETLLELNTVLSGVIQSEKLAEEQAQLAKEKEQLKKDQAEFAEFKAAQQKEADRISVCEPAKLSDTLGANKSKVIIESTPEGTSLKQTHQEWLDGENKPTYSVLTSKELMIADVVQWGTDNSISNAALDDLSVIIDKYMK